MTLTFRNAPLGSSPAGSFDCLERPRGAVLYWEPWPKRFRVIHGGVTLADTLGAHALHETDNFMRLYVPRADVAMDALEASATSTFCPLKGRASYWSAGRATDLVWAYENPIPSARFLAGHLSFDLARIDRWMMEDDEGYAHPRDPYHRCDIHRTGRQVTITAHGQSVARSGRAFALFETGLPPRFYIPRADISGRLVRSDTVTDCPYKGPAQHWHLDLDRGRILDAGWSLADPIADAERLGDAVCFYPDKVEVRVDGEPLKA